MPSLKKSVMLSDQAVEYLNYRVRHEKHIRDIKPEEGDDKYAWSNGVNEAFKALKWLSGNSLPNLTSDEWHHILNVYNGCFIEFHPPYRIASDMMDNTGEVDLDNLEPEYANVVRKMHELSQIEQFAVMDFVQKFWCNDWNNAKDFDEIKEAIKSL